MSFFIFLELKNKSLTIYIPNNVLLCTENVLFRSYIDLETLMFSPLMLVIQIIALNNQVFILCISCLISILFIP